MVEKIKMERRRYAKRLITWFKKDIDTIWLYAEDTVENNIDIILKECKWKDGFIIVTKKKEEI